MFIAGTVDWAVRNMDDEPYPVFTVWESGGKLLGVAGGQDGLAELFIDVISDYEKSLATKRPMPTTYAMIGVQRTPRGKVTTQEFVATITPDDAPNADPLPDIGKGGFGAKQTNHHVVVSKVRKARK